MDLSIYLIIFQEPHSFTERHVLELKGMGLFIYGFVNHAGLSIELGCNDYAEL